MKSLMDGVGDCRITRWARKKGGTYQTVATPYLRLVKTIENQHLIFQETEEYLRTLVAIEHLDGVQMTRWLFPKEMLPVQGIGSSATIMYKGIETGRNNRTNAEMTN